MKRIQKTLKNWIDTDKRDFIRTFLLSEGFGFCLCLSLITGYRLDKYGEAAKDFPVLIPLSLIVGTVFALTLQLLWGFQKERKNETYLLDNRIISKSVSLRIWLAASVIILACWIPVWLAYYPVIFAYDANTQLSQVISGTYSTHHPLLHTLWLGACMKLLYDIGGINAGMALYAVTQMIVMAGIFGWTMAEGFRLINRRGRQILLVIYGAYIALFPANPMLAVSATKDVVFSGLVLVFVLLLRRTAEMGCVETPDAGGGGNEAGSFEQRTYTGIAVSAALMIAFRNNAVYALVLMTAVLTVCRLIYRFKQSNAVKNRNKLLICIATGILAGLFVTGGLKFVFHAESGSPREALSIPIQQIARVRVLHAGSLDPETLDAIDRIMPEQAYELYDPHLSDPVKRLMNMKDPGLFIRTWIRICAGYPGDCLDAWLLTTEGAWYIYDTSVNEIYGTGGGFGYLNTDIRPMPEGFEIKPVSAFPGLREVLERLTTDNAFQGIPGLRLIFAPSVYVWLFFVYIYTGLVKRKTAVLIPGLFMLGLLITILMGPAILVRYMYPFMISFVLFITGYDSI